MDDLPGGGAHGWNPRQVLGWLRCPAPGGSGHAGAGGGVPPGFRPGKLQAFLAGLAEFGGGLLLAVGLGTPVAAALILTVMLVAVVSIHLPKGFWVTNGGYEYNLVLAAAVLALAFIGPGLYSVDAVENIVISGLKPGLAALVAGLVLGGGALLARKAPAPATAG